MSTLIIVLIFSSGIFSGLLGLRDREIFVYPVGPTVKGTKAKYWGLFFIFGGLFGLIVTLKFGIQSFDTVTVMFGVLIGMIIAYLLHYLLISRFKDERKQKSQK